MKVSELIELLEEQDPDAEVLVMMQESWPFECALALCSEPVPGKRNSRARRADKVLVSIALAINRHPDYVQAFAQGYDGWAKWPGFDYSDEWLEGFADGEAFRREDLRDIA